MVGVTVEESCKGQCKRVFIQIDGGGWISVGYIKPTIKNVDDLITDLAHHIETVKEGTTPRGCYLAGEAREFLRKRGELEA